MRYILKWIFFIFKVVACLGSLIYDFRLSKVMPKKYIPCAQSQAKDPNAETIPWPVFSKANQRSEVQLTASMQQ